MRTACIRFALPAVILVVSFGWLTYCQTVGAEPPQRPQPSPAQPETGSASATDGNGDVNAEDDEDAETRHARRPMFVMSGLRSFNVDGGEYITCTLQAMRVKQATMRLRLIQNGRDTVIREVKCDWAEEQWRDAMKPVTGQLLFLVQNGAPFGAADKGLPRLAVQFDDDMVVKRPRQTEHGDPPLLEGGLTGAGGSSSSGEPMKPGKEYTFIEKMLAPPARFRTASGRGSDTGLDRQHMMNESKSQPKRVTFAVTFEWMGYPPKH